MGQHPAEELPSYLVERGPARPVPAPVRVTARDVAHRVGNWVTEIVEGDGEMAPAATLDTHVEAAKDDTVVVHRVLGDPARLLDAFDRRWGLQPSSTRAALGTLDLAPTDEPGSGPTRALSGRMRLRLGWRAVPVELEVLPWHTYGLVLTLRPVRHGGTIGRLRRQAWFAAGHRILDQMRRALETTR